MEAHFGQASTWNLSMFHKAWYHWNTGKYLLIDETIFWARKADLTLGGCKIAVSDQYGV